jgi:hypothetical protein
VIGGRIDMIKIEYVIANAKDVSELERAAAEVAIAERLGPDAPKPAIGAYGYSPYSGQTVVFLATGADVRGARVALAPVCKSNDGASRYNGRGRWRTVCVAAPKADGELAVCAAADRDAEEVGSSGFFVRPWATHEAEQASRRLGLAKEAIESAFAAIGL